jgi:hypothetical protein
MDLLTKDLSIELVYTSREMSLKLLKWNCVMIVTQPSWLKISRSRLKGKTKSYNIFSSTWKLLFHVYSYDKRGVSYNMIKGEQCS